MLTTEENNLLTRVGPGTGMGELLRRYWLPAALSQELQKPGDPPIRVKLLGESLVAFRDTAGRVGLLDEFCAHRQASLFLGRNEEAGLRCIYHGWQYDVEGKCLDMPNEPTESTFKDKVRQKAYPTMELGGVVWAYMGPTEKMPPLPKFEWTQVPESDRLVSKTWQECNWLQALEGGIDSSHSSFLHRALRDDASKFGLRGYRLSSTAPMQEIDATDYGFVYWSIRPVEEGRNFVRAYQYVMPIYTLFAQQIGFSGEVMKEEIDGHMFVPVDDANTMVYNLVYNFGREPLRDKELIESQRGRGSGDVSADFRKVRNKNNDWLIDRDSQKKETFTGIEGINTQDHAVQESMGPIVNRTKEHLGTSDKAVIAARRSLLQAVRTVQEGHTPPGAGDSYYSIRAIERVLPPSADWRQHLMNEINPGSAVSTKH
jgi:nitrite reductase/ring-hydroxylating ferredoxin subunit